MGPRKPRTKIRKKFGRYRDNCDPDGQTTDEFRFYELYWHSQTKLKTAFPIHKPWGHKVSGHKGVQESRYLKKELPCVEQNGWNLTLELPQHFSIRGFSSSRTSMPCLPRIFPPPRNINRPLCEDTWQKLPGSKYMTLYSDMYMIYAIKIYTKFLDFKAAELHQ